MSRVLAYTSPARGHLFPLVPILDELRDRGNQVALRTLASEVPPMQARDFDTEAIEAAIEAINQDDWQAGNPRRALAAAVKVFTARAAYDAEDLRVAIAAERPDAVIVDINSWGALSSAEQWGGPWASFCPYPLALRSRDVPPFGPGLPPAHGSLGRLRDRLLRPLVLGAIERTMKPGINLVRSQLGLRPLATADELFRRPPLLLYLTAEPFEYPRRDWPDSILLVGPCAWEPTAETPTWLDQIDEPLVLVSTSSEFQNDGRLVQVAMEALADEPFTVVATMPAGTDLPVRPPANARVEQFTPHGPLLDRAICAVTHGGMGVTQKALARGVPVCAVPFGRDQLEVARRVEVAGAGTRLPAGRLRPDRLRAAVQNAIACADGARRVADGFAAAGGPVAAADAIESRLLGQENPDR